MLALKYIHRLNILHRDLKTSNILLQENGDLKIGDFGIARVLEGTMQNAESVVGTPYYMSPEICQNQPYSFKSDVWSLGCVLYELCSLEHAFRSTNLLNLVYKIVHDEPDPIPAQYSSDLVDLIHLLLRKKLEERPTLDELMKNDFVRWFLVGFMNTDRDGEPEERLGTMSDRDLPKANQLLGYPDKGRTHSDSAHPPVNDDRYNKGRISSYDQWGTPGVSNQSQKLNDLTPMQKLKLRKELEAKRRGEEMKKAVRQDSGLSAIADHPSNAKASKNRSALSTNKQGGNSLKKIETGLKDSAYQAPDPLQKSNKSALKISGKNVITNFDSGLTKSLKKIEPGLPGGEALADSQARNDSRSSYMNTIRQNLEETIQSQYFPDIKSAFAKGKGSPKPGLHSEEKDDFPPDFEEVSDEWAN